MGNGILKTLFFLIPFQVSIASHGEFTVFHYLLRWLIYIVFTHVRGSVLATLGSERDPGTEPDPRNLR